MEAFGVTVEGSGFERESGAFEVWPENWDIVIAFLACETQWRAASTYARVILLGLDYVAVDVVLRRRAAADHVFDGMRIMERAALAVFKDAS